MLIVGEPILMAVLTRQHTCSTGTRKAVGHETAMKDDAFLSNAVHVGCLNGTVAIGRKHLSRMVVGHYIYNVGTLLRLSCQGGQREKREGRQFHLSIFLRYFAV